jgi:hypothetical protein
VTLVIDDQVELEAVEPAHRGLAECGTSGKDAMLMHARIATDRKSCRVDEVDARTAAPLGVKIGHQRNQQRGHQLDEVLITQQGGKLAAQVTLHVLSVIGLECDSVTAERGSRWSSFRWDASGLGAHHGFWSQSG